MAQIDFSLARRKHIEWKAKLRSFLDGKQALSSEEAVSHKDCALGKWMYADGLKELGHLSEMKALEEEHTELHTLVRRIVELANAGQKAAAEQEFTKIDGLSRRIVNRLNNIEFEVTNRKRGLFSRLFNLSIRGKITAYGLIATALLVLIGAIGFHGVATMQEKTRSLVGSGTVVDASMEMVRSVVKEQQMIMEFLAAEDDQTLAEKWGEHQEAEKSFEYFAGGILKGADGDLGKVYPTQSPELRKVVDETLQFYVNELDARVIKLHTLTGQVLKLAAVREEKMHAFEKAYDAAVGLSEKLETQVRSEIATRVAAGATAKAILAREDRWADLSMEIKAALGRMRIAIEEYSQDMEAGDRPAVEKRYNDNLGEVERMLTLLKSGGVDEGQRVQPVGGALLKLVAGMAAHVNAQLRPEGDGFVEAVKQVTAIDAQRHQLDEQGDAVAAKMADLLDKVETGAKANMAKEVAASAQAASELRMRSSTALIIGVILSAVFGFFIVRAIARPLHRAVAVTRELAEGNLDVNIEVTSHDEMGQLLTAMENMCESLRTVVGEVRSGSNFVSSASAEISAGNSDLSQRTEEQASSLEETASSMEELTSTVRQNSEHARQADELAREASKEAGQGSEVVARAVGAMGEITSASKKIADIIGVVDEIAFQTNLLALNAAVEAARAGEHGRGFAVVAGEVRQLSQRSSEAAKQIKDLINDSLVKVDEGSRLVDDSGSTLSQLMERVQKVSSIVAEIAAATVEQSAGIEQVNKAIMQMDQVTQQNAAMVEEMAASSKSLEDQAGSLQRLVEFFRLSA